MSVLSRAGKRLDRCILAPLHRFKGSEVLFCGSYSRIFINADGFVLCSTIRPHTLQ